MNSNMNSNEYVSFFNDYTSSVCLVCVYALEYDREMLTNSIFKTAGKSQEILNITDMLQHEI